MESLSDARVLLLAAQLTAVPDLRALTLLAATRNEILLPNILYRVLLTYLPADACIEAEQERQLISFLKHVETSFSNFSALDHTVNTDLTSENLAQDAERSLAELRLEQVPTYSITSDHQDTLADFVIAWLHKLEGVNGLPPSSLDLVDQFVTEHKTLQIWRDAYLKPLSLLQNEYYVDKASTLALQDIETMQGIDGVSTLLQFAQESPDPTTVGRDLREVVAPWVRGATNTKRRKVAVDEHAAKTFPHRSADWQNVNEWIFNVSRQHFELAANAVEAWGGPTSIRSATENPLSDDADQEASINYIRTVLALIYMSKKDESEVKIQVKRGLLRRAADLAQLMPPDEAEVTPNIPDINILLNAPSSDLLDHTLLLPTNMLTRPSSDAIDFLHGVLATQALLARLQLSSSTKVVASMALFESENEQKQELRRILNQIPRLTKSILKWEDVRTNLYWLHSWSMTGSTSSVIPVAYLGRLDHTYLDLEILDAMLTANDVQAVKEVYLNADSLVIAEAKVQERVVHAILHAYDNASNGNRTRGGVKKASDLLTAFKSYFSDSSEFGHLEHLIKATHSISFYQLTLHHGVPFQPASIRVSSDPLSLIEKLLHQNHQAYTKLDDLLAIARNFVLANLPMPPSPDYAPGEAVPLERKLFDAEHRITYSAIEAALADQDFDTAYSLITTRLAIAPSTSGSSSNFKDDTSWRAAYAAAKYRPSASPTDIHSQIAALQKRMELLSTALALAPNADPLPEILATWRRCEEELDSLKSRALQEERALEAQSDNLLPGAFGPSDHDLDVNETQRLLENRRAHNATGPSYEEETPMGLFDVARGAASALRKNAFPLRGGPGQGTKVQQTASSHSLEDSVRSSAEYERPGSADGSQRVRKRDMLSNAVSGGLMSGMSWVLGAQPGAKPES